MRISDNPLEAKLWENINDSDQVVYIDGLPVSIIYSHAGYYMLIGYNIQAAFLHPKDIIEDYVNKFDTIAKEKGYPVYFSSGQDYRVYIKNEPKQG